MNKEEIKAMRASRKLDVLIAEKVMGWTLIRDNHQVGYLGYNLQKRMLTVPHYSSNISAAWQVVRRLRGTYIFSLNEMVNNSGETYYLAEFHHLTIGRTVGSKSLNMPEALCKAALLSKWWEAETA